MIFDFIKDIHMSTQAIKLRRKKILENSYKILKNIGVRNLNVTGWHSSNKFLIINTNL